MTAFVVQVNTGGGWRKRRDVPVYRSRERAERMADRCEAAPRRPSCSDGYPHRVVERA